MFHQVYRVSLYWRCRVHLKEWQLLNNIVETHQVVSKWRKRHQHPAFSFYWGFSRWAGVTYQTSTWFDTNRLDQTCRQFLQPRKSPWFPFGRVVRSLWGDKKPILSFSYPAVPSFTEFDRVSFPSPAWSAARRRRCCQDRRRWKKDEGRGQGGKVQCFLSFSQWKK